MCVDGCVDACSRVYMCGCRVWMYGWMYAAQEEEKCLAADAGRLTHGPHGNLQQVLSQQNRVENLVCEV